MNREPFMRGFVLVSLLLLAVAILVLALAGGVNLAAESMPTPVPGDEQQLTWKSLNGPQERAAFGLAVIPRKKKSRLFAATWGQGVYCTTVRHDDGSYDGWKPCSNGLGKYIRPLAALPSSETTVYAGSGGQGLFWTRNSGFSWEQLPGRGAFSERKSIRNPLHVESILVVPNARKALFRPDDLKDPAGLASKLRRGDGDVAQYLREHLSPDMKKLLDEYEPAGEPPEELKQALAAELNRLLQNDCLGDIVGLYPTFFADNYYKEIANTERVFVGNHNGVWVSDNWGERWNQVTVGFADTDEAHNVQALAYSPADRLYAGTLDGLYVSANGGQAWELVSPPDSYPDEASRILSLAVLTDSNSYTDTLLVGTDGAGLYAVNVENQSWSTAAVGFPDNDRAQTIQALLAVPGGAAYAGTVDFGVYLSDDGGQTWQQKAEGLPADSLSILALIRDREDGTVYAGTYGDGVYRLRPESSRWEPVNEGFPPAFPLQAMAFVGPSHEGLLAGVQVGGIYVNTNRESPEPSWTHLPKALPIGQERNVVALAASGPDGNRLLIATGVGLFLSADGGRTSNPLGVDQGLPAEDNPVRALAQGKRDPRILYAVLGDGGDIYRSENGGQKWEAVLSDLSEGIRQGICCLETGGDDNTVYLGLGASQVYTQVYVTTDGGRHWDPLAPIDEAGSGDLEELAWSDRSELDEVIFGGRQEMLYARVTGGIYVSYDHGASWQQKLSGSFSSMAVDPEHPWVIYAASEGHTLSGEWISVKVPPQLWSSEDGGESWSQIGPGPIADSGSGASINVLVLEPGKDAIYAGTEAYGIYSVNLSPARRSPTPTFLVRSLGLVMFLLVVVVIVQAGRSVPRPWRPDWPKWPQLAYLRTRYPKQFNLVSKEDSRLPALERLALACVPGGECEPAAIWQRLTLEGIPVGYAQTKAALDSLVEKHRLLLEADGEYHPEDQLLSFIAQRHFWEYQPERERSAEQTRQEIHTEHLGSTIRFFERAGFILVLRLKEGFVTRSDRSEQMIYVHVHTLPSLEVARESIENKIREIYRGELEGRTAFLVVNTPPHPEICHWAFELKEREQFDLYLIPYDRLCRAADAEACHETLQEILWLARGNQDLFRLDEPASSRIDFFGREELLERLVVACQSGELIGLEGMRGVGKTSLVHQVVDRLSESIVATVDLRETRDADLYLAIRRLWQEQAERNDPRLVFPSPEDPLEEPDEQQIQDDLAALMAKLSPRIQLVAVLEGVEELPAKSAVSRLAGAIGREERVSLLMVFNTCPRRATPHSVLPLVLLDATTSAQMVYSLSGRMALEFSPEAVEDLYQASGGHPLILRQLASLSIVQKRRLDRHVTVADVREAVAEYVNQTDSALGNLWESLTEEEQRALWAALGKAPAAGSPGRLHDLGWLRSKDGQLACFSEALAQWLTAHPPPDL